MGKNNLPSTNFNKRSVRLPLYKIVDKDKNTIPFKRNKTQIYLESIKKRLKEKFGRIRLIILKGRQSGITTNETILGIDRVIMRSNQNVGILAHTDETRIEIFDKVKFAFNNFPDTVKLSNWTNFYKPKAKYDSKYELSLLDNHSKIKVVRDPRGSTRSSLHISEMAFIKDAGKMLAGTLPSVPESWDIVIETTANGFGNDFEKLWTKYENKWENREWTCVFLPWFMVKEYQTPLLSNEKIILPKELNHLHKPMYEGTMLTEEQKKWYLEKYNSYTDPRIAFQEYPSSPREAFLTSGTPVFNADIVNNLIVPEYKEDDTIPGLYIYREPDEDTQCVYWGDTCAGVPDWDNACIIVRDWESCELLACYYEICEPSYLCKVIDRLIQLWYWGRIAVEINNTWYAFYEAAKDYEWYDMLYNRATTDRKYNRQTSSIGWETNSKTRPILMEEYKEAIRSGYIQEIDPRIKNEMYTLIYNSKMKEVAQEWHHDDGIMTDWICYQARKQPLLEF